MLIAHTRNTEITGSKYYFCINSCKFRRILKLANGRSFINEQMRIRHSLTSDRYFRNKKYSVAFRLSFLPVIFLVADVVRRYQMPGSVVTVVISGCHVSQPLLFLFFLKSRLTNRVSDREDICVSDTNKRDTISPRLATRWLHRGLNAAEILSRFRGFSVRLYSRTRE